MEKTKKGLGIGSILLLVLICLVGCHTTKQSKGEQQADKKIEIVASFYPVYAFTKAIVGDEANVSLMVQAGTEAHSFEPTAKDLAELEDADLLVYHHEEMETWVSKWLKTKSHTKKTIKGTEEILLLPASDDGHTHEAGSEHDHHHNLDPHTWVAPSLAIKEVESIERQLSKQYPAKKRIFQKNSEKFLQSLRKMDQDYQKTFTSAQQKSFVTQHTAFRYLAVEYGLNQIPISGINPENEPSPKRLAEIQNYVKEQNIQTIYMEENTQAKVAKTIATAAKVKIGVLNPLESLTTQQQKKGTTYLDLLQQNLTALAATTSIPGAEVKAETATTKTEKTVYNGYFTDRQVKDRPLTNYQGSWQSVYPLVEDGTLDQVFSYKAKLNKDKSQQEYKDYYAQGYQTNIQKLTIKDHSITFEAEGKSQTFEYTYSGYKVLQYAKGNRGVRYLYTAKTAAGEYQYVQFSDHGITNQQAQHFHIYVGGGSQQKLLEEMENWPTFYPKSLTKWEIAQEMLNH